MRVVVVGANGQLGTDLCRVFDADGCAVVPLRHANVDVRDGEQLDRVLKETRPDVVLNTAAFHKVEICEEDPPLSFAVNAVGARHLALACRNLNAVLVHFSTDYVFGGDRSTPYQEDSLPRPLNVYGASKLAGESMIDLTWPKHFIVRTCGLYGAAGSSGKGGNFVETMLRKANEGQGIKVVDDQVLTPTFTADLAVAVHKLIATEAYGLYHVSAEGQCSWFVFAKEIFELEHLTPELSAVKTDDIAGPVKRPSYSVLSKNKLKLLGIEMPAWEDGLERYLRVRKRQRKS